MATRYIPIPEDWTEITSLLNLSANTEYLLELVDGPNIFLQDLEADSTTLVATEA